MADPKPSAWTRIHRSQAPALPNPNDFPVRPVASRSFKPIDPEKPPTRQEISPTPSDAMFESEQMLRKRHERDSLEPINELAQELPFLCDERSAESSSYTWSFRPLSLSSSSPSGNQSAYSNSSSSRSFSQTPFEFSGRSSGWAFSPQADPSPQIDAPSPFSYFTVPESNPEPAVKRRKPQEPTPLHVPLAPVVLTESSPVAFPSQPFQPISPDTDVNMSDA